ncbi:DDE family transposase [Streptomyces sp. PanSC19]|nr:DDE family transposase [Streptomyces sp. PanSC19]
MATVRSVSRDAQPLGALTADLLATYAGTTRLCGRCARPHSCRRPACSRFRRAADGTSPDTDTGPDVVREPTLRTEADRVCPRGRGITAVIPEKADQAANRRKKGSAGGRRVAFDPHRYRRRNTVERCFQKLKAWRGIATRHGEVPRENGPFTDDAADRPTQDQAGCGPGRQGCSSRAIRTHLRRRGIRAVIPQPAGQAADSRRRGRSGGRPPAFDRETYQGKQGGWRPRVSYRLWPLPCPFGCRTTLVQPLSRASKCS